MQSPSLSSDNRNPRVAYQNAGFVEGEAGRPIRILSEYLGPLAALESAGVRDTIVLFGSARITEHGPFSEYYQAARQLAAAGTSWSKQLAPDASRFLICSGGGGGIMEAANRGAAEAGGRTIGFNIGLPFEQRPNAYVTRELSFEFHYFFMRKLWFAHLARAIVVFPGGFGTLDELFEILTLSQTHKLERKMCIVLYGSSYWKEVLNFEAFVKHGMIAAEDLQLFHFMDDALACLQRELDTCCAQEKVDFAKSVTSCCTSRVGAETQSR